MSRCAGTEPKQTPNPLTGHSRTATNMHKLLQIILKLLSKVVIKKYNPIVLGITGSVGKTSTKEAVFSVLKNKFRVRRSVGSFNTEEGLPLAILGDWSENKLKLISQYGETGKRIRKIFLWVGIVVSGFLKLIFIPKSKYPEILVLEYGADRPGDIDKLVQIATPQTGIITGVGEIPVHVEYYSGPEEVAKEKSKLISALPPSGLAVLNHDDWIVFNMKDLSKAETITFGFDEHSEIKASDMRYFFEEEDEANAGLSFKLNYEGKSVPFRLSSALGKHQIYAALAATAVGLHFNINLIEISEALEKMEFPKQRMKLVKGIRDSWIIDDTYNASPLSTQAALETLYEFGNKAISQKGKGRKVAVLGDMRELGVFTEKAHRLIGNLAGEKTEYLFTVGPAAKFIADSAFNQLPKENIRTFDSSEEAGEWLKGFVAEGDIVLVKGSRAMEMEKVVEALIPKP